tara:strand:+ start:1179 stop:2075 length:897 start_codon:yes stop_codon:yes gene_type:complete
MNSYETLELSKKNDIETVEKRFMHLCAILQNNNEGMGKNLDKFNEYEKAYKKICEHKNVWINSAMINNMKNSIFKENKSLYRKGEDINIEMGFTIEDLFNQNIKKIQYMRNMENPYNKIKKCHMCDGNGKIKVPYINTNWGKTDEVCKNCEGFGVLGGMVKLQYTTEVEIKQEYRSGEVIKIKGEGHCILSGDPGDLYIKLKLIEMSHFKKENYNIIFNAPIGFKQAMIGTHYRFKFFDNRVHSVKLKSPLRHGYTKKIKNLGFTKGDGTKGKLILKFAVMLPEKLTEEQKNIIATYF